MAQTCFFEAYAEKLKIKINKYLMKRTTSVAKGIHLPKNENKINTNPNNIYYILTMEMFQIQILHYSQKTLMMKL